MGLENENSKADHDAAVKIYKYIISDTNNDENSHAMNDVGYENKKDKDFDEAIKQDKEDDVSNEIVEYDRLVSAAGEFGRYQVFLTGCTFPFYVFGVFAYFGQLFLTEASPNHWCWVPELVNLTALERRALAIPLDTDARFGYSQCEMFVANWSEVLQFGAIPNQSWTRQACRNGWEFNDTEIPYPTITSEMGWVCDKASYQATAQAIFFVGSVFGGLLFGWLSDRFGRIPTAVMSNTVGCVAGVISVFAKDFVQFCICRFIMGLSYDCCMMMTYLLVLEFVAPKYRSLMANLPLGIYFSFGATILPWMALACGHWKTLSLSTSLPMALALLTPFILPESPKWLLIKGRIDEATDQITTIARVNKKEIPVKLIEQFKMSASKTKPMSSKSLLNLAKRPILRNILVCLCLENMCCMIIFDALVRGIGSLEFDFFLSFTLVSLTECPSLVLISFILDLTGRKWLSISCFIVCSAFTVLSIFVSAGLPSVMCAVIARFAINMSASIALQWGAEMMPTPVRGSAVSFIHIIGFIGTILSPYIVYLENYVTWLPSLLIGAISLLGAASALVLPETAGRDMPQSFDDAEVLSKGQVFFDVPCLRKKKECPDKGQVNPIFQDD